MAQVGYGADLGEWIDDYLAYLIDEWLSIEEVADEWDSWEDYQQLDFVIEWPIRVDRLKQLRGWAAQNLLTPTQLARYQELLQLIELHGPTLARLLED